MRWLLLVGLVACSSGTRGSAPEPTRPAAPPAAPAPAAAPAGDPYACTSSDECEIFCPDVAGCCGWPCGCDHAIRRDHHDWFHDEYARTCTRMPDCPAMGCAYKQAMGAVCHEGRCVAGDGLARP